MLYPSVVETSSAAQTCWTPQLMGGEWSGDWINLLIGDGFFSGFACFYKRRTGTKTDGCAVCYKHSRFQLISLSPIEYFRPGLDILNRDNVGLVLLLQPLLPEGLDLKAVSPLCVANTHVLFNPRRGDIKLAQMALLLAEIDKIAKTTEGSYYPVILCGDLNSVPDSPLYKFIRNGELSYHGMPAWKVGASQSWHWVTPYCMLLEKCMAAFFLLWGSSPNIEFSYSAVFPNASSAAGERSRRMCACCFHHCFSGFSWGRPVIIDHLISGPGSPLLWDFYAWVTGSVGEYNSIKTYRNFMWMFDLKTGWSRHLC